MTEQKFKNVSIKLTEEEHRKLKVLAAEMGLTIKALLLMCVERLREEKDRG